MASDYGQNASSSTPPNSDGLDASSPARRASFGAQASESPDNQAQDSTLASSVREAVAPMKETLTDLANQQKSQGADRLGTIAGVIRDAAPRLEQEMPELASYVRSAGSWVEKSAGDLKDQKFEDMLTSASQFARKQPVAAFGIAVVSGFALARFLKSDTPQSNASTNSN